MPTFKCHYFWVLVSAFIFVLILPGISCADNAACYDANTACGAACGNAGHDRYNACVSQYPNIDIYDCNNGNGSTEPLCICFSASGAQSDACDNSCNSQLQACLAAQPAPATEQNTSQTSEQTQSSETNNSEINNNDQSTAIQSASQSVNTPASLGSKTNPIIVNIDSLTPGQTVQTNAGQYMTLTSNDGSQINLGPNSSYQAGPKNDPYYVSSVSGTVHAFFSQLTLSNIREKLNELHVKLSEPAIKNEKRHMAGITAVAGVRGTEFIMNNDNGQTTFQLLEGSLSVSDIKGKKTVILKPGQQVTGLIAGGLSKVTTFSEASLDQWYNQAPPAASLLQSSVQNAAALDSFALSCNMKANPAQVNGSLSTDEQQRLDWYNKGAASFAVSVGANVFYSQKKFDISMNKKNLNGTTNFEMRLIGNNVYYQLPNQGWKKFADKTFSTQFLAGFRKTPITNAADVSSLSFADWSREPGSSLQRLAGYSGNLTANETVSLLSNIGIQATSTTPVGSISVGVRLRDYLWEYYNEYVNAGDNNVVLPVINRCTAKVGGDVKNVVAPKKATSINAKAGEGELIKGLEGM